MCVAQPLAACASGKSLSKRHSAFPVGEYVAIVVRLDNVFGHAVAVSDKFVHRCDIGILVVEGHALGRGKGAQGCLVGACARDPAVAAAIVGSRIIAAR